jgi:hypothetical protein
MSLKKSADQDGQGEELSPSDKEFDSKLAEFVRRLPESLKWVLLAVVAVETGQELISLHISNRVETIFRGEIHGQAFATPISETPRPALMPVSTQALATAEVMQPQYNFQVGQTVEILGEQKQLLGVISEIAHFNGTEGSKLSFLIVDFPDGSWGGFNPDQLNVITDTAALSPSQTSP